MAIMLGTGEILSFFAMVSATGATIKTVATLSIKADMMPAKSDNEMMAHFTLGVFSMIISARSDGILDSINNETTPIVPAIIRITFQSTAENTILIGRIPSATKSAADAKAIYALYLGNASNRA